MIRANGGLPPVERTKSGWPAVWMEDELRSMNPWRWMWLGVWVWLWPGLAMLFWTVRQAPGGWPGMLLTIFWFLGVLLLRYVGALTYNWWIGPKAGFCWIRSGNDVLYICQRRAIGALTVFAGPWGLWTGAFVNVAGWARVIPHRWAVLLIAGPIGAWLIGWLTIVLYNRLSDIFDVRLAIRWLREPDGEWRVIAFDAERVRALSSLLGFSWTIGGDFSDCRAVSGGLNHFGPSYSGGEFWVERHGVCHVDGDGGRMAFRLGHGLVVLWGQRFIPLVGPPGWRINTRRS